jgi:hypothetical protein
MVVASAHAPVPRRSTAAAMMSVAGVPMRRTTMTQPALPRIDATA